MTANLTSTFGTSIMMCTYNRLGLTKRMLRSLFGSILGSYRLIIVDNGSTDGTVEWIRNELIPGCASVIYLHCNEKNLGIAIGRNQGLAIADGYESEYLATVDNDVEFHKGWLEECLQIIHGHKNKISIGLNMEGTNYPLLTRNGITFQHKPIGNLGTACAVFHKDLHKQIGFFNTEYGLYGEEDADFFFRAKIAGYEMGYLKTNGTHFGEGALDTGEYREFKTRCHKNNLAKFQANCRAYINRQKPYYIPFDMAKT